MSDTFRRGEMVFSYVINLAMKRNPNQEQRKPVVKPGCHCQLLWKRHVRVVFLAIRGELGESRKAILQHSANTKSKRACLLLSWCVQGNASLILCHISVGIFLNDISLHSNRSELWVC